MPFDQREDDALSLCFDGYVLTEALPLLGGAEVELTVEVDAPEAILALRLNDVSALGTGQGLGVHHLWRSAIRPLQATVREPKISS